MQFGNFKTKMRRNERTSSKINMHEPRRFSFTDNDRPMSDELEYPRFGTGTPPFGHGRRPSPPIRDRSRDLDFRRDESPLMRDRSPMRESDDCFSDRFKKEDRDFGFGRGESPLMRDQSPMLGSDDRFSDRYTKEDRDFDYRTDEYCSNIVDLSPKRESDDGGFIKREERDRRDSGRPFYGEDSHGDRFMDKSRLGGPASSYCRFDGHFVRVVSDVPYRSSFSPVNYPSSVLPPPKMIPEGFPKPNECEIIAVTKHQRAYAESVEARLKDIGIAVGIICLKDEAYFTQTIDYVAHCGTHFAMVIDPQNETHGSVTVKIVHGRPQEYRNMPLEDALKLFQNFYKHIPMQRENMERERVELCSCVRNLYAEEDKRLGRASIPPANIKLNQYYKIKDDLDMARKEQDLQDRIVNTMHQGKPSTQSMGGSQGAGFNPNMPNINIPPTRANKPCRSFTWHPPSLGRNSPGLKYLYDKLPNQSNLETSSAFGETAAKAPFTSSARDSSELTTPRTFTNFGYPTVHTVQKALHNLIQTGPIISKNVKSRLSNSPPNSLLGNISKPEISSNSMGQGVASKTAKRFRPGGETYCKAINPVKMAVVIEGYPEKRMLKEQATDLELLITSKIGTNIESFIPTFLSCRLDKGALIIKCSDLESSKWLEQTISEINPWQEQKLFVGKAKQFVKTTKIIAELPKICSKLKGKEVLKKIEEQNVGLTPSEWNIADMQNNPSGPTIVLSVPEMDGATLARRGYKFYIGLHQVQAKLHEKITKADGGESPSSRQIPRRKWYHLPQQKISCEGHAPGPDVRRSSQ